MTRSRGATSFALAFSNAAAIALLPSAHAAEQVRSSAAPPQKVSVRWTSDPSDAYKGAVEVFGLSAAALKELEQSDWKRSQWQRLLSVFARQKDLPVEIGLPAMLGSYRIKSGTLCFEPQFPLEPGVKYKAIFDPDQLPGERRTEELISVLFEVPRRAKPATVVRQVYPSTDVVPENLLKFYVHFSAPMSRGHIYDHIHLRNETGKEIELPFLEIDEELWDPAMTRLTLFIDPGRIKRGVLPLEEVGPALEAGKRYTLVIDQAWTDGAGNPLQDTFRKAFKVGPPDREPPDPAQWKIQASKSETRDPLAITFADPMDHALAQRLIRVADHSGELVEGKTTLDDQERRWSFIPTQPWRRGAYNLVIQTTVEDLAGNNIGKPFEVDLVEAVQPRLISQSVKLPFEIR